MNLQEFVTKWSNKKCDFDGFYGGQCVDLYRMYVQEVLQVPQSPGVQGAKDIWNSYLTDHYERIANTPEGAPLEGDIMIWGDKYGPYGHVAIVTKADTKSFTCFSQNDPSGALCGLKTYTNWTPVLGWLHPKNNNIYKGYDLTNLESMKVAVDVLIDLQNGNLIRKDELTKVINDGNQKLVDAATIYEKEKAVLNEQIKALQESLVKLQDTEHTWADQADVYQRKLKAVLEEFVKVGVSVAVENTEADLVSIVSTHLSNAKTDRKLLEDIDNYSVLTPEDVLDSLQKAADVIKERDNLLKEVESLKKKDKAITTISFGGLQIKVYKL